MQAKSIVLNFFHTPQGSVASDARVYSPFKRRDRAAGRIQANEPPSCVCCLYIRFDAVPATLALQHHCLARAGATACPNRARGKPKVSCLRGRRQDIGPLQNTVNMRWTVCGFEFCWSERLRQQQQATSCCTRHVQCACRQWLILWLCSRTLQVSTLCLLWVVCHCLSVGSTRAWQAVDARS